MDASAPSSYSLDEIRAELLRMGYSGVGVEALKRLKTDLDRLLLSEHENTVKHSQLKETFKPPKVKFRVTPEHDQNVSVLNSEDSVSVLNRTDLSFDSSGSEQRKVKRKVLRKRGGETVIDESVHDTSSSSYLADFRDLPRIRKTDLSHRNRSPGYDDDCSIDSSSTFSVESSASTVDASKKSVILTPPLNPHTDNLPRHDPVARFRAYQSNWTRQKAPGEKAHKDLRWDIREQCLYVDPVVRPSQRRMVKNTYVVPTEKKRQQLRWQVRSDLAEGRMPLSLIDSQF